MLFCSTTLALLAGGVPPAVASHPGPWGFGLNDLGQVGDGTAIAPPPDPNDLNEIPPAHNPNPTTVVGSHTFKKVAAGGSHSLGLKNDDTVWAWGNNSSGQLGNGTTTASSTPVQVTGLTGVTDISAGDAHSVAVKGDRTVHAWGSNFSGQLGDGTTTDRSSPVQVKGVGGIGVLEGVSKVAAGAYHTLALSSERRVYAWGGNDGGQLGNGTIIDSSNPVVAGITDVKKISAGSHSLAITEGSALEPNDDPVYAWGPNNRGQLGFAADQDFHPVPTKVSGMPLGATQVAAASSAGFSLALKQGEVWSWGANFAGQLGHGDRFTGLNGPPSDPKQLCLCDPKPAKVRTSGTTTLANVADIAAGYFHALAIQRVNPTTTNVVAWGSNQYGQLGNGSSDPLGEGPEDCIDTNCSWFAKTVLDSSTSSTPLANVRSIAGGSNHSLAAA